MSASGSRRDGQVVVAGRSLHSGEPTRVTVRRTGAVDETTFDGAPLSAWRPFRVDRSTAIAHAESHAQARTVEHLFAALAGLGWGRGIAIDLEGAELPILDGCSAAWLEALAPLDVPCSPPRLRVVREARIDVGQSRYSFSPGETPRVSVEIAFDDPRLAPDASWSGDPRDFADRIATARTFCFARELDELARAGLASHVTPEMVVVIGETILAAGRPFEPDEPARHKLLDLMGDLFLYGGPPRGHVHAHRPGHWTSHEAVRLASERGVFALA